MQPSLIDPEFFSLFVFLFVSGAFAGFLAGLFGVGGGIILVPALLLYYEKLGYNTEIIVHMAVGTSLAIIVPTSMMSAWSHHKNGSDNISLFRKLALPVILGALLGSLVGGELSGDSLKIIFASLTILIALNLLQKNHLVLGDELPALPKQWIASVLVGLFSSVMGIGGGVFFNSYFTAYKLPILKAVGASASLGVMISLPGAIGYILGGWNNPNLPKLSFGYLNFMNFLYMFPITMLMAPIGARISHTLNKEKLKRWFALFLILMSLRLFYKIYI